MDVSFFQELLGKITDRGRQLLDLAPLIGAGGQENFESLCDTLVSSRGEASGVALARRVLALYEEASPSEKDAIFAFLASRFVPDSAAIVQAARKYLEDPGLDNLDRLALSVEPPRQELLRRLNLAPGGTAALVRMRQDLLARLNTSLNAVDRDFVHLFSSWFNRGFLVLARMSWSSPASILEKIIAYEAVHEIQGWDDLRRRLDPHDRRCFAFFHPALIDEPLIFVEVALGGEIPSSIQTLLESEGGPDNADPEPSAAVFYSISNCQEGLRGISFGNFLIKQVVEDLSKELPSLKTFVTLSPVPAFRSWLFRALGNGELPYLGEAQAAQLERVRADGWSNEEAVQDALGPVVLAAAAHYFLLAKDRNGRPLDPVARFHLGNGARLERIHWLGDTSEKGVQQALSLMVNYRYDLRDIERNHEAYVNQGSVVASKSVRALLLAPEKTRALVPAQE
ncbi:MAG: malonyl-CoA decarboxylase [Rhodomicrobium sp.]